MNISYEAKAQDEGLISFIADTPVELLHKILTHFQVQKKDVRIYEGRIYIDGVQSTHIYHVDRIMKEPIFL